MWMFFAFASAFAAGATAILAKIGIKNIGSNLATALRTVVVLVFAWIMVFVTGANAGLGQISAATLTFLVLSGLATGASWLCYFRALQLGDVNKIAPIDKTSTVLTMLLAFLILREPLNWLKVLCMLFIGTGTLLMVSRKKTPAPLADQGNVTEAGPTGHWLVPACLSAVFASLTAVLGKIGISGVDSNLGTAIRTAVVLLMAWLVVFITGEQKEIHRLNGKNLLFLTLSGITTGTSWLCYYKALQDGPASVVVPIDKLSILVTIFFSVVILKEKFTLRSGIGLTLITAGTLALLI